LADRRWSIADRAGPPAGRPLGGDQRRLHRSLEPRPTGIAISRTLKLFVEVGNGTDDCWKIGNSMSRPDPQALGLPPPPRLRAGDIALFLDVDGTLLEIEREPGAVHVPDELCRVLDELQAATGGALALVSGRSLEQLDRLFSPLRLSAAGLHGLERRNLGSQVVRAAPDPAILARAWERLSAFAAATEGVLLEDKGLTLALHYRNAPAAAAAAVAVAEAAVAESAGDLVLLRGKMVCELKPPGADKGQAIAAFMEEPPFAGRRPVFAGDDVTDEAGFATINALGGISIRIGGASPTAATFGHRDVTAVQSWLLELLEVEAA
jgi:trehalose 6-phosphate phosphatase